MQLGMIGLGRMGANMVRRLMRDGHECAVWDVSADAITKMAAEGATGVESLEALVGALATPRAIWIMVPAAHVDATIAALSPLASPGDTLIDGGNTHYHADIRRARELSESGLHYVDVGTSGGVFGLDRGYSLMIGGEVEAVSRLDPIFSSLAPGIAAAPQTPGREQPTTADQGYLHCGPAGAGHFVKMIHNGIEYGLMAAYAEGFNILRHADVGKQERARDAETTPLEHPEHYLYSFDLPEIAEVWRRGSVIGSWLLDLTAKALTQQPDLGGFSGHVSDSGEGRWTALAAVEEGVPATLLTAALQARFASRGRDQFANQVLSAMRYEFGGHGEAASDSGSDAAKSDATKPDATKPDGAD